jgi:hypothetical protein
MSFALPFARSASNDLTAIRLAGLGLAAIAVFLFTLAAFAPQVLGDGDTWSHSKPFRAIAGSRKKSSKIWHERALIISRCRSI